MSHQISSTAIDTISQRFRVLAIVLYVGTLIIAPISWFVGRTPSAPILNEAGLTRFFIFITIVGLLLSLDLYVINRYQLKLPPALNRQQLIIRVVLVMLALVVAEWNLVMFIYLQLSLYAYLVAGRKAGLYVAGASFVPLFYRLAFGPRNNFISGGDLEQLLLYCLLTIFVLLLGNIITQEAESKKATRKLLNDLAISHQQLEQSMDQVAELATTEERNRLARDIHDGLGHYLAAISIQLEMAIKLHEQQPTLAKEAVIQAKVATGAALNDVRQSVSSLRNGGERFSLRAVLDTLVAQIANDSLQVNYHLKGDESRCPQQILLTLYRAAQEGLTNCVKHAAARNVDLSIDIEPTQVTFLMRDDGVGFVTGSLEKQSGFGLRGIRERVELVNGTMNIEGRPNEGTVLQLSIPYRSA
ncbi:MAG: sensor histidine kinase [Chloroflexota bacterium]